MRLFWERSFHDPLTSPKYRSLPALVGWWKADHSLRRHSGLFIWGSSGFTVWSPRCWLTASPFPPLIACLTFAISFLWPQTFPDFLADVDTPAICLPEEADSNLSILIPGFDLILLACSYHATQTCLFKTHFGAPTMCQAGIDPRSWTAQVICTLVPVFGEEYWAKLSRRGNFVLSVPLHQSMTVGSQTLCIWVLLTRH